MIDSEEFRFANDIRAAMEERTPKVAWTLVLMAGFLLAGAFVWANWAIVEEVTTGVGRVIPSSQMQVVQTLEGGIIRDIRVAEGDMVESGQVLLRIDDTGFAARLGELQQKRWSLEAEIARLQAEADGKPTLEFDDAVRRNATRSIKYQHNLFQARRIKLDQDRSMTRQQLLQKEQELLVLKAKEQKIGTSLVPLERELLLTERLKKRGVVSEVELLRLQRQVAELRGERTVVRASIPRAAAEVAEAKARVASTSTVFQTNAHREIATKRNELAVIDESLKAARDRVVRTSLKAPVRGIVNKLNVTTVGAVVHPGRDIVEIVPIDDNLLIESRIRPQDVAFIRPGQKASVKLSAYDYLVYGALEGEVERISPDTIADERGETFYRVIVRTIIDQTDKDEDKLQILPGMVATVDILTGEKSVLQYLLKPIKNLRHEALRER